MVHCMRLATLAALVAIAAVSSPASVSALRAQTDEEAPGKKSAPGGKRSIGKSGSVAKSTSSASGKSGKKGDSAASAAVSGSASGKKVVAASEGKLIAKSTKAAASKKPAAQAQVAPGKKVALSKKAEPQETSVVGKKVATKTSVRTKSDAVVKKALVKAASSAKKSTLVRKVSPTKTASESGSSTGKSGTTSKKDTSKKKSPTADGKKATSIKPVGAAEKKSPNTRRKVAKKATPSVDSSKKDRKSTKSRKDEDITKSRKDEKRTKSKKEKKDETNTKSKKNETSTNSKKDEKVARRSSRKTRTPNLKKGSDSAADSTQKASDVRRPARALASPALSARSRGSNSKNLGLLGSSMPEPRETGTPPTSLVPPTYRAAAVVFYTRASNGQVADVLLGVGVKEVGTKTLDLDDSVEEEKDKDSSVTMPVMQILMGSKYPNNGAWNGTVMGYNFYETAMDWYMARTGDAAGLSRYLEAPAKGQRNVGDMCGDMRGDFDVPPAMYFSPGRLAVVFCQVGARGDPPPQTGVLVNRSGLELGPWKWGRATSRTKRSSAFQPPRSWAQEARRERESPMAEELRLAWVPAAELRRALDSSFRGSELHTTQGRHPLQPFTRFLFNLFGMRRWLGMKPLPRKPRTGDGRKTFDRQRRRSIQPQDEWDEYEYESSDESSTDSN